MTSRQTVSTFQKERKRESARERDKKRPVNKYAFTNCFRGHDCHYLVPIFAMLLILETTFILEGVYLETEPTVEVPELIILIECCHEITHSSSSGGKKHSKIVFQIVKGG